MKTYLMIPVFLCIGILTAQAQSTPPVHHAPNREFNLLNIKLQFHFGIKEHTVHGIATEKITPLRAPLDSLHLNAVDMHIDRVSMNGAAVRYRYDDTVLTLLFNHSYMPADTLTFKVTYDTHPVKGLTFITPDKGYPNRNPEIWSQSEMEDARYWIPCHDYPDDFATSEVIATVPAGWQVISNGALESKKENRPAGTVTFDWVEHKPHVIYLISLIAGRFNRFTDQYKNIPLYYYSDPQYGNMIVHDFRKMPDILHFYEQITGRKFAWEKLALTTVTNFIWGGEENVSAITLTDQTLHDTLAEPQVSSTSVIAHETAHQWFGDLLTCRNWANSWLNEGFATYFEALYERHAFGNSVFDYEMYRNQESTIAADNRRRQPTVNHRYYAPIDMFNTYIYARGASILNMLRSYLGDTLFDKAIRHYVHEFQFRNVDTHDLENAVSEATGYNMYWFFNQWLYKAGHPKLKVHYRYDRSGRRLFVYVRQVQKTDSLTPVFRLPVDLYIRTANSGTSRRIWVRDRSDTVIVPLRQAPLNVEFDKKHTLLAEINVTKPVSEWRYQLEHDDNPVARIQAVLEIARLEGDSAHRLLVKTLQNDAFWAVRVACIRLLTTESGSGLDLSPLLRKTATTDADARVRVAAVQALGNYHSEANTRLLRDIYNSNENYFVRAGAVQALANADSTNAIPLLKKALAVSSYNHIITSAALMSLAKVEPALGYRYAVSYSRYGEPENLRVEAVRMLVRSSGHREETRKLLTGYLKDPYIWVRAGAIRGLGRIGKVSDIPVLRKEIAREPDGRLRQAGREAIENIQHRSAHG